jgi:hypothetical protein
MHGTGHLEKNYKHIKIYAIRSNVNKKRHQIKKTTQTTHEARLYLCKGKGQKAAAGEIYPVV